MKAISTGSGRNRLNPFWSRTLVQGLVLYVIWLLFSGKFDPFHMGTGVAAVLFVMWLDRKMGSINLGDARVPLRLKFLGLIVYVPWLFWQMILSSIEVSRVILSPERANPALINFRSPQPHVVAKVVLGNSITMTPGTLTLDIEGDRFLVHALSEATTSSLLDGSMQKTVAALFSKQLDQPITEASIQRDQNIF